MPPPFDATLSGMIIPTVSVALHKRSTRIPQVNPRFLVACVTFLGELQIFTIDFESTVLTYEQFRMGVWRAPQWCGATRHRECAVVGTRFASPTCDVEVPRDKIDVFLYYCSTDCAFCGNASKSFFRHTASLAHPLQYALSTSMKTHLKIRLKSDLVEKNGAPAEVSHMKLASDDPTQHKLHRFLQNDNVPCSSNVIFNGSR